MRDGSGNGLLPLCRGDQAVVLLMSAQCRRCCVVVHDSVLLRRVDVKVGRLVEPRWSQLKLREWGLCGFGTCAERAARTRSSSGEPFFLVAFIDSNIAVISARRALASLLS